jgi:hypothetical protein
MHFLHWATTKAQTSINGFQSLATKTIVLKPSSALKIENKADNV